MKENIFKGWILYLNGCNICFRFFGYFENIIQDVHFFRDDDGDDWVFDGDVFDVWKGFYELKKFSF